MKWIFIFLLPFFAFAKKDLSSFKARVSRVNREVELVRFRTEYANLKYLQKNDKIEFYNEGKSINRCLGYVKGRTNEYFLIKVPRMRNCQQEVAFTVGSILVISSEDFRVNLNRGIEVVDILIKKRAALNSRYLSKKRMLDTFINKVEAVTTRYRTLQEKLQAEWAQDLSDLETDKIEAFKDYKQLEVILSEIDFKLEQYKIHDPAEKKDRWAMDKFIYTEK